MTGERKRSRGLDTKHEMGKWSKEKTKVNGIGDFRGGAMVKNPPANAGDTGSNPGPGRSHMLRSN